MESFFRAVAIGLGVLMGTFNQGIEPELQVTVYRGDGTLMVSGTLARALSPKLEEALDAGVSLALVFQASVDGTMSPAATHQMVYLPLTRQWQVSKPGRDTQTFSIQSQAAQDWGTWSAEVQGVPDSGPFVISVQVALAFPDRPDWQADMVWKSPVVVWQKAFSQLSEIPF